MGVVTVKRRRDENRAATRSAIVAAAADRFARDGYGATSIDAVAADAGVAKGSVYYHYADKTALFEAVFAEVEAGLVAAVAAAAGQATGPSDALRRGIAAYLDRCLDARFRRLALEEAPVALGWSRWKALEAEYFLGILAAALSEAASAAGRELPEPELAARMLLAALSEAGLALAGAAPARRAAALSLLDRLVGALVGD